MGDQLKQADGTIGTVTGVQTVTQAKQMYNLSVGVAHTYFVGEMGWLVHNATDSNGRPYATYKGMFTTEGNSPSLPKVIAEIRAGRDVTVDSIDQARQILEAMDELRPYTEDRLLPNPDKGSGQGFDMPRGVYKGDLINKQDPLADVHPGIDNVEHGKYPHYNIKLPNGLGVTIVIKCRDRK